MSNSSGGFASDLKMKSAFFPLKKLRRNSKYLVLGAVLLVGVAVYHEMVAVKAWTSNTSMTLDSGGWKGAMFDNRVRKDHPLDYAEGPAEWKSSFTPQTWRPEYKGQANLHVFEDWCGSSVADLSKNLHYPLYPHSRTTVRKLAVSPQWTNYGLRIFGHLHPFTDGDFVFALSSDDNSELWLSTDDSPLNVQLLAWVGKTGTEWTAPGEFDKYASQTSRPVWLSAQRRYFFEVIHQQNDRGTDHVEVAWQLLDQGLKFMVIESNCISLYVNESALLLSDVAHIPQTAASHQHAPTKQRIAQADMLREDPRDALHSVPLIDNKFLRGVLPDCTYQPSYIIKDFPLLRYQGLQFVHMSYVYPNDYTRLTHMETQESCFYSHSPYYMKMYGFSRFMKLDRDGQNKGNARKDFGLQGRKSREEDPIDNALSPDYGDDYDDYAQERRRKLFSLVKQETNMTLKNAHDTRPRIDELQRRRGKDGAPRSPKPVEPLQSAPSQASKHRPHLQALKLEVQVETVEQIKPKVKLRSAKTQKRKSGGKAAREQLKAKGAPVVPPEGLRSKQRSQIQRLNGAKHHPLERNASLPEKNTVAKQQRVETKDKSLTSPKGEDSPVGLNQRDAHARKYIRNKEIQTNMPPQHDLGNSIHRAKSIAGGNMNAKQSEREEDQWEETTAPGRDRKRSDFGKDDRDFVWGPGEDFEDTDDEDLGPQIVFDTEVNWNQTFHVSQLDLQRQRLDVIDLRCNISGNLLLDSADVLPVIKAFMDQLNQKHDGQFTLVRVVNVVKRVDQVQGSRYLLELELKDGNGQPLRLSHYIYSLMGYSRQRRREIHFPNPKPQLVLCNPVGFHWNPRVTVHIIVPVKNQARWVQQLIADMEQVFRDTQDANFNLIITDYSSTDMDVRKALEKSSLPRYQYLKLSGNFERSAGLQAGIDMIDDDHSIVFLCDLHIYFPTSIVDTIRKHCVEGHMAFAPIVLRLDCGATPSEAKGYWEVNGFGLLGIYKSDLDAVGGMNTREFTDRWGGEDWELLDRILQAGLEVERIHLRSFFHYYHSKRGMWNRQTSSKHR